MNIQLRSLGDTGIEVSPICLGSMTFGNPVEHDEAVRLIHWALDHEINFIDTADMYEGYDRRPGSRGGVAESIIGKALKARRDRAVIATKVGSDVGRGATLAPDYIARQIDASLGRLGTDYVDIYELHRPDPDTPIADSIEAMAKLIEAGKARCWGFSNYDTAQARDICALCDTHGWPRPKVSQPCYNWLNRGVEKKHMSACRELGIAVTPYRPLEGGLLTGKYRRGLGVPAGSRVAESSWLETPDNELDSRIEAFLCEAKQNRAQPAQYAIRWLLNRPGVTSVVVGAKHAEHLSDALRAIELSPS